MKSLFQSTRAIIVTVTAFFLMGLFIFGVGPTITGSTVWNFYEITLKEGQCQFILDKDICLTKIFNPSLQDDDRELHALITVGNKNAKTSTRSVGSEIKVGDSNIVNGLKIVVQNIDLDYGLVSLKVKKHHPDTIQNTGLRNLWYPFVQNQKANSVLVYGTPQDKSTAYLIKQSLKQNQFEMIYTLSPEEYEQSKDDYTTTNLILVGTIDSNSLIKDYLTEYDSSFSNLGFLNNNEGYIHLIYEAAREVDYRQNERPAVLIVTGESFLGTKKAASVLANKDYYDLIGDKVVVQGECSTISNCRIITPELVI